jgi:hypothetical protein
VGEHDDVAGLWLADEHPLEERLDGGEPEADACEHLLAWAARKRGTLDVAIAEGLAAPDVPFDAASTEDEIDARLRAIAQLHLGIEHGLLGCVRQERGTSLVANAGTSDETALHFIVMA